MINTANNASGQLYDQAVELNSEFVLHKPEIKGTRKFRRWN